MYLYLRYISKVSSPTLQPADDHCAQQLVISVAYTMDMLGNWISNDWKENAPELAAFMGRINELPKIKKWIETRPHSEH